jgi:amidase
VQTTTRGLVAEAPGIPFGISFAGKKWSEETLVGLAYAFEQRTGVREKVKPYMAPTVEIADILSS